MPALINICQRELWSVEADIALPILLLLFFYFILFIIILFIYDLIFIQFTETADIALPILLLLLFYAQTNNNK